MRKTMLVLLFLLATASLAFAADEGFWQRADCATDITSPVAGKTWCRQTTTTGGFNAGDLLKYDGAWKLVTAQAVEILTSTVANLPVTPLQGTVRIVTDGVDSSDCSVGGVGNENRVLCEWDGTAWGARGGGGGGAEVDTLDTVFDRGKVIDGANDPTNAAKIGNGTVHWLLYCDGTGECFIEPDTAGNRKTRIATNFTWCLWDNETSACILTVDPDAASANAKYTLGSGHEMLKSVYWPAGSMSSDGTQCADPAEVTINSGPKLFTIICTDNDLSRMHGSVVMPDSWDGGTMTFEVSYVQTAADTAVLNMDVAAACRGAGEAINSTYGTEVEIDDAAVSGSNIEDQTTSAAVTPNGTCAAGDFLYWYLDIDATGTTTAVATLHIKGVKMEYSVSSLSD